MPNWVNVKLSAHQDVINAITCDKCGEKDVDFELIMPIPPDLKDYWTGSTVSLQEQAKEIIKCKLEYGNQQHLIPMTEKDKERFRELYGAGDWYDWCVKNWGCKWNAQTDYCNSDEVGFQTPWEEPYNWIHHLSLKFPNHKIWVEWEEEQGYGEVYSITSGKKEIAHEWGFAEWGDEIEVGDFTVAQCIKSGGRGYEAGMHKYVEGQFYLDYDEEACYSSLEELKQDLAQHQV
jgi:hypothetical protein